MNRHKTILGFTLFGIGLIGILSLLTVNIPLPPEIEKELLKKLTPQQIKLVLLINPSILLLIMVTVGTILYDKLNFRVPIIEQLIGKNTGNIDLGGILKFGMIGGIASGVLLGAVSLLFLPLLPPEFIEAGEKLKLTLAGRFLYGGFTEEIMMRFGFMTVVVWVFYKLVKELKPSVYWGGIIVAAIMFGLGHLPLAFQLVENPPIELITYILVGNSIGGIIFGWLYWKKGLESAIVAHVFTHVILVMVESLF